MALRRPAGLVALLACLLAMPAAAEAAVVEPPQLVAGANSRWISGDLLQQTGLNCSTAIIGSSYTEVMVAGNAGYGGTASGGVPKVGEPYWTSFLVSIPGNPCGAGSSSVVTTLILPPSTRIDSSRQIKCYGLPRNSTASTPWQDLTNASWNFLGQSGPYCASQATVSPYHQGGNQIGFRPLANGQLFWIFVPVISDGELKGAGGPSPGHGFTWMTDATGVYANPGRSFVWANVLPNAGSNPFVYFATEPAAIPYWKEDAPNDPTHPIQPMTTKSRVEWLANLYSAGKAGSFCWELHKVSQPDPGKKIDSCSPTVWPGWQPAITTAGDLWQVFGDGDAEGPNGGYSPLYYDDDPPGTAFFVRWTFYPSDGSPPVSKDAPFTTLAGADQDGDGVPNNGTDSCPGVKGTLANGCLPAVQEDPDRDGVYGSADLCPDQDGQGALNGCLGGILPIINPPTPPNPPAPKVLVGVVSVKKGAVFKRAALSKGAAVKFTCTVDSAAAGTLTIAAKVAKKLGLKVKKKQKNVTIAKGSGRCTEAGGGSLKLKVIKAAVKKVKRARKAFAAALAVKLTAPGQTAVTMKRSVKVR